MPKAASEESPAPNVVDEEAKDNADEEAVAERVPSEPAEA